MPRLLVTTALVVAACVPSGEPATTISSPGTPRTAVTSSTTPTQAVEVQDCDAPPVTFSALCEIYGLIVAWHVDAPVDPVALADAATRGLHDFSTEQVEEAPRTLFCAIPHPAFTGLCDEMADKVLESGTPVGPAIEAAVAHMIEVGLDPFTYYVPPDQVGAFRLNGIVGGVGLLLDARDAVGSKCTRIAGVCRLEIVTVLEDNPGFFAGLEVGDIVTEIDGESVEGKGFADVVTLIAGDETGSVAIAIERGGERLDFAIERAELAIPTVEVSFPHSGVGYIRIPDFEFDIPELVREGLEDLLAEGPGTIIVDLRDNPGGYVDAVVDVADDFIDDGTVMVSRAPDEVLEYEATSGGPATRQRLIVLVNRGTASAAEILAGALRDRRSAVVVGTSTFGKDAVQIPFTLRNGGELHVAVARWSTPEGHTAANGGLSPDHEVTWPSGASTEEIVSIALEAAS